MRFRPIYSQVRAMMQLDGVESEESGQVGDSGRLSRYESFRWDEDS